MRLPARRVRGMSLVEALVAMTLLATVSGSVVMVMGSTMDAVATESSRSETDFAAWRAAEKVTNLFELAGLQTFDPPLDPDLPVFTQDLRFSLLEDVTGGVVQWSDPIRVRLELEEGETDDGTDENGNGLVDERIVVALFDEGGANERRVVLAHDIRELYAGETFNGVDDNGNGLTDEPGLCFRLVGDSLHVFVTVEETTSGGTRHIAQVETALRIRNP